jgi:hypothetical protein
MTNKLVVIINSLKVLKIKKILLCEMKFLVPNYSCLQNPLLGACRPQIPFLSVVCPQLNLLNPTPNKIPGYASDKGRFVPLKPYSTAPFHGSHFLYFVTNSDKYPIIFFCKTVCLRADSQRLLLRPSAPSAVLNITSLLNAELDAAC